MSSIMLCRTNKCYTYMHALHYSYGMMQCINNNNPKTSTTSSALVQMIPVIPVIEGVLKLFLIFSPAKPRNISIFEQKKPMKLKKRSNGKQTRLLCTLPGNYHVKRLIVEVYSFMIIENQNDKLVEVRNSQRYLIMFNQSMYGYTNSMYGMS